MSSPDAPAPSPLAPDSTRCHSTSSDKSLTATSERRSAPASPSQLRLRSTSPSSRLLSQTRASAAKTSPASLRRKPLPSSRPLSFSKIPRRDASLPTPSVPATRWGARVAQRVHDAEQSNEYALRTPSATSTRRHPLSIDKPLPLNPIASLTNSADLRDSRTLIDAGDLPLRLSVEGRSFEWPAMNPSRRSVSAPEQQSTSTNAKAVPSSVAHKASSSNALNKLSATTSGRDRLVSRASRLSCRSSVPSFVSAEESIGSDAHSDSASVLDVTPQKAIDDSSTSDAAFPPGSQSLRASSSNAEPSTADADPCSGVPPLPDRVRNICTPASDLSKQSGSTANFSRPHDTGVSSKASHSDLTSGMSARQQKTASRIPLPGSSRARLVSIQHQNLSLDTHSPVEGSPSFGARRLNSPDALAVLELGTKRRLQRTNTNGSVASNSSAFLPPPIRALRASSRSRSSSPAATVGASTDDEDELNTPISQPSLPRSGSMAKLTPPNPETDQYEPASASPLDIPRMRRNPPSKSRHTRPLQTIPSQSVLTAGLDMESPPRTKFSTVATRLSQAQRPTAPCDNPFIGATDSELRKELTFVRGQDEARVKSGLPGLTKDARGQLNHTLDCLEGQGAPASESIDPDKLNEMFGHLTWRSNRTPKTNTFIDNAAAAALFVERGSVGSEQIEVRNKEGAEHQMDDEKGRRENKAGRPKDEASGIPIASSKWSDSAPSAVRDSAELSRKRKQQTSIGYPSAFQTPSIAAETTFAEPQGHSSTSVSRNSSPTLGSTKQHQTKPMGSVRRARENMPERGGFSRPTVSAMSKKAAKTSISGGKAIRKTDGSVRGRNSTTITSKVGSTQTVNPFDASFDRVSRARDAGTMSTEPRSRSKSRAVFAKINGFFSHKRDKKSQQIPVPPLPSAAHERAPSMATLDVKIDNSEPFRHSSVPPVPAMPAMRATVPPQHEPPRSPSRATDASELSLSSIYDGTNSVMTLAEKLISKAKRAGSTKQRARMVAFARVLHDAMLNAKEAQISAEKAHQAAIEANTSYQMTKKALDMMEKLASSLVKSGVRH